MTTRGWRKLTFDGARYQWRVSHDHHVRPADAPGKGRCREVFTVRSAVGGGGTLRIEFTDSVDGHAGYPAAGVVWRGAEEANLNQPRTARAAIEVARARGWSLGARGTTVIDGWTLLTELIARHAALGPPPPPG